MSIEIHGLSPEQMKIADMIWQAETMGDVDRIVILYGPDAVIARDMIIAAFYDDELDTDIAKLVLARFMLRPFG